jgi:hypothetical protein
MADPNPLKTQRKKIPPVLQIISPFRRTIVP